jgi:hypothetical protein
MNLKRVLPSPTSEPERNIRKELEFLYHRRSAIESLIRSLENYRLFQPRPVELSRQKPA